MILAAARKQYQIAENNKSINRINSTHVKIKGEYAMEKVSSR